MKRKKAVFIIFRHKDGRYHFFLDGIKEGHTIAVSKEAGYSSKQRILDAISHVMELAHTAEIREEY